MGVVKFQLEEKHFVQKRYDASNLDEILTPQELQVFKCLCVEKLRTFQIADRLGIDRGNVSHRITSFIFKINELGTDEFRVRFNRFLAQNNIKRHRTCKSRKIRTTYPDGVFLTKTQMLELQRLNKEQ